MVDRGPVGAAPRSLIRPPEVAGLDVFQVRVGLDRVEDLALMLRS